MNAIKKRKRAQKRAARTTAVRRPYKTIKGVVVTLGADYGTQIRIPDGKASNVVQKINAALKDGKLIELGGEYVSPKYVVRVQQTKWEEYSL